MSTLKSFEISVINLLTAGVIPKSRIDRLYTNGELVSLDFTGAGYLLTLRHSDLPVVRSVLSDPHVNGKIGELLTGFIVIIENQKLTLECFAYGDDAFPQNFRELDIAVFV